MNKACDSLEQSKNGVFAVIEPRTFWKVAEQPSEQMKRYIQEELNCSDIFASLCIQRGMKTKEEISHFLKPDSSWFHDPEELGDMKKAVARIENAVAHGEKIFVYGDYDADGVTSTALLIEALRFKGADPEFIIPNRFVHGYGPNKELFKEMIDQGASLIITCDNGISGHEAISYAQNQNVDVIVTDHHELPGELPEAYALIHPRLPGTNYPFGDLSGAGVAYKLACSLAKEHSSTLLELAAIGTVADLVSMTDENRAIVAEGLKALKKSKRIGLKALLASSDIEQEKVNETSIGFSLAPRLNAAGRLGEAMPAVQLLLTTNEKEAEDLAKHLQMLNEQRKELVEQITEEALLLIEKIEPKGPLIVLAQSNWHEGVLGIVASRIVQETGKPALLLNIDQETGIAKGSGRSVEKVNLYEAMNQLRPLMEKFGGHHMAAGLSIQTKNLSEFTKKINTHIQRTLSEDDLKESLRIDICLTVDQCSIQAIEEIGQLAPFGTGNEAPIFMIREAFGETVKQIGGNGQHVKLLLSHNQTRLDAVGFNMPQVVEKSGTEPVFTAVGTLEVNEWRNKRKPQLMLKDLRTEGIQWFDVRSKRMQDELLKKTNIDFVFFDQKKKDTFESLMSPTAHAYVWDMDSSKQIMKQNDRVILMDCPSNLSVLEHFLQVVPYEDVYVHLYAEEDAFAEGMPTRENFAAVYKYIVTHANIPLYQQGETLASYLRIPHSQLSFMISVFFEAGFVTIEDGLVNPVKHPSKIDLTKTDVYRQREEFLHTQKVLQYSSFAKLAALLQSWCCMLPVG